jgi:hypothetical protein
MMFFRNKPRIFHVYSATPRSRTLSFVFYFYKIQGLFRIKRNVVLVDGRTCALFRSNTSSFFSHKYQHASFVSRRQNVARM